MSTTTQSSSQPPCYEFDIDRLAVRLHMTVPADTRFVTEMVDGIMKVVAATGCACGREFELELSLREALVNAVIHGAKDDPSKSVECCLACDENRGMLVVVRDPGTGFDPATLPSPLYGEQLFSEHGRGLFLINQLMDDVQFRHGGAEIRMRKFPPTADPCRKPDP